MIEPVIIYTDGACRGNPGPGGWGVTLSYKGKHKELCGGERQTTNNRMELMAAIQALEALTKPCTVTLHSDSSYVLKGITEWMPNWKKKIGKQQPISQCQNVMNFGSELMRRLVSIKLLGSG